jgi:hypothetical protein
MPYVPDDFLMAVWDETQQTCGFPTLKSGRSLEEALEDVRIYAGVERTLEGGIYEDIEPRPLNVEEKQHLREKLS